MMKKPKRSRSRSGPSVPEHQRHTVRMVLRVSPSFARRYRTEAKRRKVALNEMLEMAFEALVHRK